MLVVNIFGGPGSGKSTLAAHTFAELKYEGILCELVTEFAKDLVWEGSRRTLDFGLHLLGEQYRRLKRLEGQVDVAVTDSPLPLSLVYKRYYSPPSFDSVVWELFRQFNNMNFFIRRSKAYSPVGRLQTEHEARGLDVAIENLLQDNEIPYKSLPGERVAVLYTVLKIKERIHHVC